MGELYRIKYSVTLSTHEQTRLILHTRIRNKYAFINELIRQHKWLVYSNVLFLIYFSVFCIESFCLTVITFIYFVYIRYIIICCFFVFFIYKFNTLLIYLSIYKYTYYGRASAIQEYTEEEEYRAPLTPSIFRTPQQNIRSEAGAADEDDQRVS